MSAFAERLLGRIEAIERVSVENSRQAADYAAMGEELRDVTGTARSSDRAVTVVAGAGGAITDIRFSEVVSSMQPGELSRSVLSVLAHAQAEAARKQAEVVRSNLGSTEALDRVIAADERLFGAPRPG